MGRTDRTLRRALLPATLLLAAQLATGCGSDPDPATRAAPGPAARTVPVEATDGRIGVLLLGELTGPRMCTASVVDSPRRNLLVTAAHCVQSAERGSFDDLVFAPGYREGRAPYGVWPVDTVTVDPRWVASEDPDYDVAFLTVDEVDGLRIQDRLGAYRPGFGLGFDLPVTVTGYPHGSGAPVTCSARTTAQSATQERFACSGYTVGTSGSPWLTAAGELIGVIGGYQEGGDTDAISYSVAFDQRVANLYHRAAD
ncbi:trypsin-like peptidase domain-containing protein [Kitasatospora sp. NPDC094015]|uniref:trypsin-like serine peptidase n=1 Tax=Kitasatospora sp. NPDC094015 TaxID=3155205 RepID=UPI003333CD9B